MTKNAALVNHYIVNDINQHHPACVPKFTKPHIDMVDTSLCVYKKDLLVKSASLSSGKISP